MRNGFSLIELLVVVAIIGILATVGLVGYQIYIDTSRDEVSKDLGNYIDRTVNSDIVSIQNNLSARSELTDDIERTDQCWQVVYDIVSAMNGDDPEAGQNNPFNNSKGALCDGVHAASGSTSITLPRGATMVYCDGIDAFAYKVRLSGDIALRRCTCVENSCTITSADTRCVGTLTSAVTSSSTSLSFNKKSFSAPGCFNNATELNVEGENRTISVSGCSDTGCSSVTGAFNINSATLLYVDDPNACYYPFGFNSAATYFRALAGHLSVTTVNTADHNRHVCAQ